jgi:glucose/arabinose dehydrogenase
MRRALLTVLLVVAVVGCGGDEPDVAEPGDSVTSSTTSPATSTSVDDEVVPLDELTFTLTEVASLDQPLAFAVRNGVDGFYVGEKGGRVQHVASPGAAPTTVLDISDDVSTGGEQGLLGIAVDPSGEHLYVSYTNRDGDTRVDEHVFTGDTSVGERRELFAQDQPYGNHNGGHITFGPDGLLWLGLGDGGSGGDPEGRAQDTSTLLGKIIRFDPADPQPEIWGLGLRNPWRFSFDRETDDVWIGDVGQGDWEEIDRYPWDGPTPNFGWDLLEGSHAFEAAGVDVSGTVLPIFEYSHDEGQSVAGGFVYRGSAVPGLVGTYLFADTYTAELRALRFTDAGPSEQRALGIDVPGGNVAGFGEDADGELYVLSLAGGVHKITP